MEPKIKKKQQIPVRRFGGRSVFDTSAARQQFEQNAMHPPKHVPKEVQKSFREAEQQQERITQLKDRRQQLSLAELIELTCLSPEEILAFDIEIKVRDLMHDIGKKAEELNMETRARVNTLEKDLKYLKDKRKDELEMIKEILKLNHKFSIMNERFDQSQRDTMGINCTLQQVSTRLTNMKEAFEPRLLHLSADLEKLEGMVIDDRDSNYTLVTQTCDTLSERLKTELGKLQNKFFKYVNASENHSVEQKYAIERVDRMYNRVKEDISRHETLCYEIAAKFTQHHCVMAELGENISALKTYTFINEMHMEAYLPLQSATIAYEVSRGVLPRQKQEKFKKHFVHKVFQNLEKNCLSVCNPSLDAQDSSYKKMKYKLPDSLIEFLAEQRKPEKWENILEKVTLNNIHMFCDASKGMAPLVKKNNINAEHLLNLDSKILLLTGRPNELSNNSKNVPLQIKFDKIREDNWNFLKKPLQIEGLRSFEDEHYSKIKEMLDYAKVDSTTKIIGALNMAEAVQDESQLASINLLRKKKALALRQEADKLFKEDELDADGRPISRQESDYSRSGSDQSEGYKERKRRERKVSKIGKNKIENSLFSQHKKKRSTRHIEENSSDEAHVGMMGVNPALERERKRQLETLQATTDLRMQEAEENVKQLNEQLKCEMMKQIQLNGDALEQLMDVKIMMIGENTMNNTAKFEGMIENLVLKTKNIEKSMESMQLTQQTATFLPQETQTSSDDSSSSNSISLDSSDSSKIKKQKKKKEKAQKEKKIAEKTKKKPEKTKPTKQVNQFTEQQSLLLLSFPELKGQIEILKEIILSQKSSKESNDDKQTEKSTVTLQTVQKDIQEKTQKELEQNKLREQLHQETQENTPMDKLLKEFQVDKPAEKLRREFQEDKSQKQYQEEKHTEKSFVNEQSLKLGSVSQISEAFKSPTQQKFVSFGSQEIVFKSNSKPIPRRIDSKRSQIRNVVQEKSQDDDVKLINSELEMVEQAGNMSKVTFQVDDVSSSPVSRKNTEGISSDVLTHLELYSIKDALSPQKTSNADQEDSSSQIPVTQNSGPVKNKPVIIKRGNLRKTSNIQIVETVIEEMESEKALIETPKKKSLRSESSFNESRKRPRKSKSHKSDGTSEFDTTSDYYSELPAMQETMDLSGHLTKDEFNVFTEEVRKMHTELSGKLEKVMEEQELFMKENEKVNKQILAIDWEKIEQFDELSKNQAVDFGNAVASLKVFLTNDVKKCRQKTSDMESKFENMHLWSQMFNQISKTLKDDLFRMTGDHMKHVDNLVRFLDLQLAKEQESDDQNQLSAKKGKRQYPEETETPNKRKEITPIQKTILVNLQDDMYRETKSHKEAQDKLMQQFEKQKKTTEKMQTDPRFLSTEISKTFSKIMKQKKKSETHLLDATKQEIPKIQLDEANQQILQVSGSPRLSSPELEKDEKKIDQIFNDSTGQFLSSKQTETFQGFLEDQKIEMPPPVMFPRNNKNFLKKIQKGTYFAKTQEVINTTSTPRQRNIYDEEAILANSNIVYEDLFSKSVVSNVVSRNQNMRKTCNTTHLSPSNSQERLTPLIGVHCNKTCKLTSKERHIMSPITAPVSRQFSPHTRTLNRSVVIANREFHVSSRDRAKVELKIKNIKFANDNRFVQSTTPSPPLVVESQHTIKKTPETRLSEIVISSREYKKKK